VQRPPHRLFLIPLLLAFAACATGPAQELAVADMLPVNEAGVPAAPAYTLFFDLDSAALTADAAATLDRLVADPARPRWTRLILAGHADRSGSERHNKTLSSDRAEAVRRHLLAAGVPANLIAAVAFGEQRGLVGTPDGTAEPQNRRVEIYISSK
jgi:OmpA-OmpF porin, OOP family